MRLAALSVDLDEVHHYARIHGLDAELPSPHLVYEKAVSRAAAFARACQIPLTFFAVGQDLWRARNADTLRGVANDACVVENHSLSHRYDLVRSTRAEQRVEIEGGAASIFRAIGQRPQGFRAPGYLISDQLVDVMEEVGVRFDSSVLRSPPYYIAKAVVLGALEMTGRPSASICDSPQVLRAPRRPYRPGRPYTRHGSGRLVELPISVTPAIGIPLTGTSLLRLGPRFARTLLWRNHRDPLMNIELHGLDFLDVSDGLSWLRGRQPELSVPLSTRMATLRGLVEELRHRGRRFVTLAHAAERCAHEL